MYTYAIYTMIGKFMREIHNTMFTLLHILGLHTGVANHSFDLDTFNSFSSDYYLKGQISGQSQ